MAKYHINPTTGNPGQCRAKSTCPFGDLEKDHYESKEDALKAFENSQGAQVTTLAKHKPVYAENQDSCLHTDWKERVNILQGELKDAIGALATDDNWNKFLNGAAKMRSYSFSNQILLQLQTGGNSSMVAAASAWQQLGRHPKAGEKALYVLGPVFKKVDVLDAQGKSRLGPDGKKLQESKLVYFKSMPTFDVAQTEGDDLPEVYRPLQEEPPAGFVQDMESAASKAGFTVSYEDFGSYTSEGVARGRHGYTDPATKRIVVDSSMPDGARARTLAHELGHVYAGHCEEDEIGKYHTGPDGCRGRFEAEAEGVGYVLARANGMNVADAKISAQYVAGWSKNDPKTLQTAAENVTKASQKLLRDNSFRNVNIDPLDEAKEKARKAYSARPKKKTSKKRK